MSDTCLIGDTICSREKVIDVLCAAYTMIATGQEQWICWALQEIRHGDPELVLESDALEDMVMNRLGGCATYGVWITKHYPELDRAASVAGEWGKRMRLGRLAWINDMIREFKEHE